MKKGLLIVSILLFLAGGVAVAFALERFSAAADNQASAEKLMKQFDNEKDMAKLEDVSRYVKDFAEAAADARQMGWIGAGGGVVLWLGSVILFLKIRRPRTAAPG